MTIVPLAPLAPAAPAAALDPGGHADVPPGETGGTGTAAGGGFAGALNDAFRDARLRLERADGAERAFTHGHASLQAMVIERAQADVALSLAGTAASRATQALTTIIGMQV